MRYATDRFVLAGSTATGNAYGQSAILISDAMLLADGNMEGPMVMMWDAVSKGVGFQGSSLRFKTDVETLTFNAEDFLSLNAREFTWKESGKNDIGFIAEEVAAFDKRLAVSDGQGGYISMHYDKMTVYLFEIVKDLHSRVKDLENRINTL